MRLQLAGEINASHPSGSQSPAGSRGGIAGAIGRLYPHAALTVLKRGLLLGIQVTLVQCSLLTFKLEEGKKHLLCHKALHVFSMG